jgi:hypothetical protein
VPASPVWSRWYSFISLALTCNGMAPPYVFKMVNWYANSRWPSSSYARKRLRPGRFLYLTFVSTRVPATKSHRARGFSEHEGSDNPVSNIISGVEGFPADWGGCGALANCCH